MSLFGEEQAQQAYRVLARKYRPQNFDTLVGQEVLVRTLSNAIATGRIAHAFLLTGIRGVGKTTTARIIARALNCIGADGNGGPTIQPCGECANCRMILEDRHMDVVEMDAASRTGVNDVRELIETVNYAPANARYKVYIIDEVHMLSTSAFNALLKTLEEPPPYVKFIFATTELHKIPVTILSRCQKFDLKRVEGDSLAQHLARICGWEKVEAEEAALRLIANAAEGSVRDSLSLLDQAIAHGTDEAGNIHIRAEKVREMLGVADRSQNFALLNHLFAGEVKEALTTFKALYDNGASPLGLVQELMEMVHLVTRFKMVPELVQSNDIPEQEREAAKTMAEKLSVADLTRAFSLLGKGVQEIRLAQNMYMAAEMVFIRLIYASTLPQPSELIRKVQAGQPPSFNDGSGGRAVPPAARPAPSVSAPPPRQMMQPQQQSQPETTASMPSPVTFDGLVQMFQEQREQILYFHLFNHAEVVKMEPQRLEVWFDADTPRDVPGRIRQCLRDWTGKPWEIIISKDRGQPSLRARADKEKREKIDAARALPHVQEVFKRFKGAKVIDFIARPKVEIDDNTADAGEETTEE